MRKIRIFVVVGEKRLFDALYRQAEYLRVPSVRGIALIAIENPDDLLRVREKFLLLISSQQVSDLGTTTYIDDLVAIKNGRAISLDDEFDELLQHPVFCQDITVPANEAEKQGPDVVIRGWNELNGIALSIHVQQFVGAQCTHHGEGVCGEKNIGAVLLTELPQSSQQVNL